jgi:hypothetical protein
MTPDEFRKLALRLPETVEQQHQGHPDFRVGGKVFATLGWPDAAWGMVKLPTEEQKTRVAVQPGVFEPAPGAWGQRGSTKIRLAAAEIDLIEHVLRVSPRNAYMAAWKRDYKRTPGTRGNAGNERERGLSGIGRNLGRCPGVALALKTGV